MAFSEFAQFCTRLVYVLFPGQLFNVSMRLRSSLDHGLSPRLQFMEHHVSEHELILEMTIHCQPPKGTQYGNFGNQHGYVTLYYLTTYKHQGLQRHSFCVYYGFFNWLFAIGVSLGAGRARRVLGVKGVLPIIRATPSRHAIARCQGLQLHIPSSP